MSQMSHTSIIHKAQKAKGVVDWWPTTTLSNAQRRRRPVQLSQMWQQQQQEQQQYSECWATRINPTRQQQQQQQRIATVTNEHEWTTTFKWTIWRQSWHNYEFLSGVCVCPCGCHCPLLVLLLLYVLVLLSFLVLTFVCNFLFRRIW